MHNIIKQLGYRLYKNFQAELKQKEAELKQKEVEMSIYRLRLGALAEKFQGQEYESVDIAPWNHPYLTEGNIRRFRKYSEDVWQFATGYYQEHSTPLKIGFLINMAQNMYKWARMAQDWGSLATLYLNPMDKTAISCPEWEEYDGEYQNVLDADGFLKTNPHIQTKVNYKRVEIEGSELLEAYYQYQEGNRKPLLALLSKTPGIRHEVLLGYNGFYPYYKWVTELTEFDVLYAASSPLAAYASGRPYCAFSVGGDLMMECGRGDDYGRLITISFNAARFLLASNPHTLGHSRRLKFSNALYLPYPMDDSRYCPGEGQARRIWEAQYGLGTYVLMASRLDVKYKGQDDLFFQTLVNIVRQCPELRLIFLAWGENADTFRNLVQSTGMSERFIILHPVGKKRLIDYYRSCDIVLDSFIYGYYGSTALEAAAVGKPVIMRLRKEHYEPLYNDDIMPAFNAGNSEEMGNVLLALCHNKDLQLQAGGAMRDWLIRNHGEKKTIPLLLALLRITADRVPLPKELRNPLLDEETDQEIIYHKACMRKKNYGTGSPNA